MADAALTEGSSRIMRNLDDLRPRKRDVYKRLGHKAGVLARLRAANVPLPPTWVLDGSCYTQFVNAHLPRKHDLRNLIKLTGTRTGDERCARAYEELMQAPLPDEVVTAVVQLWDGVMHQWPQGVAVRPSVAAASAQLGGAARHLVTQLGVASAASVLDAIRELWAESVLACSVQALAEAGVSDAAIAIVLQQVIEGSYTGVMTRGTHQQLSGDAAWYLGVEPALLDSPRRLQLLVPWAEGQGAPPSPEPLSSLRAVLEPDGHEQLDEASRAVEAALGPHAVLRFSANEQGGAEQRVYVVAADESPQWSSLRGGHAHTAWIELALGASATEPPTRLTQSVFDQAIVTATHRSLGHLQAKIEGKAGAIGHWGARSYLNLDALLRSLADTPVLTPEDVLAALGGAEELRRRVAGRAAAHRKSLLKWPSIGAAALREQLALDGLVGRERRAIDKELSMLLSMDLTLLPSDALGTTLRSAQTLLERVTELWVRLTAAQIGCRASLRALVQRRLPEAPQHLGYTLAAVRTRSFAGALAEELEQVVQKVRRDAHLHQLLQDGVRDLNKLPDGLVRGALAMFITNYGNAAFSALELSRPRWREDPAELLDMVALLAQSDEPALVEERRMQAVAIADGQLARYEPQLNRLERQGLRLLSDRVRALVAMRGSVDQQCLRALRALRKVVLDIDRRLRRIDGGIAPGGAFHCSASRLAGALKSGRPELGRVIRMRLAERQLYSCKPPPPLSFVGSPPRGAAPVVASSTIHGLALSSGVVDGRVRLAHGRLPARLERGEVLVVRQLDATAAAVYARAGAVIAEGGGREGAAAEVLRELAIVAVGSTGAAALQLQEGERVRVDGERGVIERLDSDRGGPRSRGQA